MKRVFFFGLVFFVNTISAQYIQVISTKDSSSVSFASVLISGELMDYNKTAGDDGLIPLSPTLNDSAIYQLSVQCFGFEKFNRKFYGHQIKQLEKIYLQPSNINLDEVVVTAQYEPTTADKAVQKIRVIDKEKIQQMAAVNLRDVLSNQLNVRLEQDNVLGSEWTECENSLRWCASDWPFGWQNRSLTNKYE